MYKAWYYYDSAKCNYVGDMHDSLSTSQKLWKGLDTKKNWSKSILKDFVSARPFTSVAAPRHGAELDSLPRRSVYVLAASAKICRIDGRFTADNLGEFAKTSVPARKDTEDSRDTFSKGTEGKQNLSETSKLKVVCVALFLLNYEIGSSKSAFYKAIGSAGLGRS